MDRRAARRTVAAAVADLISQRGVVASPAPLNRAEQRRWDDAVTALAAEMARRGGNVGHRPAPLPDPMLPIPEQQPDAPRWWSASRSTLARQCQRQYGRTYVDDAAGVPRLAETTAALGTVMHTGLAAAFRAQRDMGTRPGNGQTMQQWAMVAEDAMADEWSNHPDLDARVDDLGWPTDASFFESVSKVRDVLTTYPMPAPINILHVDEPITVPLSVIDPDNTTGARGVFDGVKIVPDLVVAHGDLVEVVDWKTATTPGTPETSVQLHAYVAVLNELAHAATSWVPVLYSINGNTAHRMRPAVLHPQRAYTVLIEQVELSARTELAYKATDTPDVTPGSWCAGCRVWEGCPAVGAATTQEVRDAAAADLAAAAPGLVVPQQAVSGDALLNRLNRAVGS